MRHKFRPLQYIDFSGIHPDILYREYLPSPELSEYVACYWTVISSRSLISVPHRILTDACMDIICDFQDRQAFVAGIADNTEILPLNGHVCSFGIRFLPNCIPFLLKHNASESLNAAIALDQIDPVLQEMTARMLDLETPDIPTACCLIAEEYLQRFFSSFSIQNRFGNMLEQMLSSQGSIRLKEMSQYHSLSEKQITRCIKSHIGMSPKSFLRIIRLQHTLALISQHGNRSQGRFRAGSADIALEAGYYDQSHLLKELNYFLGDIRNIY
ncbi:AraC family transcriptional regulator [Spirochaeta dissipatitropha]